MSHPCAWPSGAFFNSSSNTLLLPPNALCKRLGVASRRWAGVPLARCPTPCAHHALCGGLPPSAGRSHSAAFMRGHRPSKQQEPTMPSPYHSRTGRAGHLPLPMRLTPWACPNHPLPPPLCPPPSSLMLPSCSKTVGGLELSKKVPPFSMPQLRQDAGDAWRSAAGRAR